MTKYELVNVPERGVSHTIPGIGAVAITPALSDQMVEKLIKLGITRYFQKKSEVEKSPPKKRNVKGHFVKEAEQSADAVTELKTDTENGEDKG